METINVRIRKSFNDLTASQKLVAHYVLDNPKSIALYPAKEIGTLTNTSETTVIRFCYSLGYSGYSELQEEVRKTYLAKSEEKDALITFREEMDEEISSEKYSLKKIMLQENRSNPISKS
jgi:DNA-binding MurR/RpiR family transcriptional regulator